MCNFEFRRDLSEYDLKFSFRLSLDNVRKTFAEFTNEKCECIYLVLPYGALKGFIVVEKVMLFLIIKK